MKPHLRLFREPETDTLDLLDTRPRPSAFDWATCSRWWPWPRR